MFVVQLHSSNISHWVFTQMNKFEISKIIGKGGQGTVYSATRLDGGGVVAIKKVACDDFDAANKAFTEMVNLQKLKHLNLVEYTDLFLDVQESGAVNVCIVMPFYADGMSHNYLSR